MRYRSATVAGFHGLPRCPGRWKERREQARARRDCPATFSVNGVAAVSSLYHAVLDNPAIPAIEDSNNSC
jgi:hypothetical protein